MSFQVYFLTRCIQRLNVVELEVLPGEQTETIIKLSLEAFSHRWF